MTAISDHCSVIRGWLNFEDYSDELITSWTRMAEELLSVSLRCKHMIEITMGTLEENRTVLPPDWLELDFVLDADRGIPLTFRERHKFYSNPNPEDVNYNSRAYTLSGNFIVVGGVPVDLETPRSLELTYFKTIPPLGDEPNWLMRYYSRLYVTATLSVAAAYGVEDERAVSWQTAMQTFVDSINLEFDKSRTSGSKLIMPRKKGFG